MKKHIFLLYFFVLFVHGLSAAEVNFFKLDKIVSNPHASLLRSQAIEAQYIYSADDEKHYMGFNFGAKIPFLTVMADNLLQFEMGGYGGIYTRFELFSETFDFIAADFLGACYFDFKYRLVSFETSVYHVSSHLGDNYIDETGSAVRNTGYEAVREYFIIKGAEFFDLSLGFEYKFLKRPESKIFNSQSVFHGWRFDFISMGVPLFFEWECEIVDLKNIPNIGMRLGIYVDYIFNRFFLGKDHYRKHYHELSFHYYYGFSKFACFYNQRENLILVGFSFRL